MSQTAFILLGAVVLAAVGCQEQQQPQPKITYSNVWPGWTGDTTIDPAGDVQKLQGRWDIVLLGTVPDFAPGSYIVVEGDTITYRNSKKPDLKAGYRFVLNSSIEPKVIRRIHWLGLEEPLPGQKTPISQWYKLEEDTVTFWDHFTEQGERPPVSYRRADRGK